MRKKYRVLMVSPEVVPFAKTGGLADVCGALPHALGGLGHDVRVLMPLYREVDAKAHQLRRSAALKDVPIRVGDKEIRVDFRIGRLPESKVKVYFAEQPALYDRDGLYVDPETGQDFPDNALRFVTLPRAALALCERLDWIPDIIHCHDWQTALIPLMTKSDEYRTSFARTRTILTIHNLGYQGNFPPETIELLENHRHLLQPMGPLEYFGDLSFLKAGVVFADKLNTVSPTYAREIQASEEYGYGFQDILQERSEDLVGILNGLDVNVWNPETDPDIAVNYNRDSLDKKVENKKALCERVGFSYDKSVPLFGIISRLASQKGFDLLSEIRDSLVALPIQLVLLGTGEEQYETLLREMAARSPRKFHAVIGFNNKLAHRIEAGVDCFLMPSRYEPCGLNQMMSMRYGTIPLVRATGGLADTVIDIDDDPQRGNGFAFSQYDADVFLETIKRALKTYANRSRWRDMQVRGMSQDFSWAASAKKYVELYEQALQK